MAKILGYIRVSSKRQAEEGLSIDEQQTLLQEYADDQGYEIVVKFDRGISGTSVNRPGFNEVLEEIKTGEYAQFVVWKLDRASRSPYLGYKLKYLLDSTGTQIYSLTEPHIQSNIGYGFELLRAEAENEAKADRTRMTQFARARMGRIGPNAKYGYRMSRDGYVDEATGRFIQGPNFGKPEILEHEAVIVRRIFDEYVNGEGGLDVVDGLIRDGIPTQKGAKWTRPHLHRIITTTEYMGVGYFGKTKMEKGLNDARRVTKIDSEDWIEIPYPPIIDKPTWEAAQALRKQRYRVAFRKDVNHDFALRHLVWCGSCGKRFTCVVNTLDSTVKLKSGIVKTYTRRKPTGAYRCPEKGNRRGACNQSQIGRKKLENIVWEKVKEILEHPEHIRANIEEMQRQFVETGTHAEMEDMRLELEKLEEERYRALTAFQKGYLEEEELDIRMKSVSERREMFRGELDKMESEFNNIQQRIESIDQFMIQSRELAGNLDDLTDDERDEIIKAVVTKVRVGKEVKVDMVFSDDVIFVASGDTTAPCQ